MHRFRVALAALTVVSVLATTATPASAQDDPPDVDTSITVTGHGWGHGRGMGQYGALGYAVDFGWSSSEILDHYYGDTIAGNVANSVLTVRLVSASDQPTVAAVDGGAMVFIDGDDRVTHLGTGRAIRLTAVEGGFTIADSATCSGPFTDRSEVLLGEDVRISTSAAQRSGGRATVGAGTVLSGDWDGDGADEIGTADGTSWTIYSDGPSNPAAAVLATFEMPAGLAVSGDWDGDGIDTAGVFLDGTWTLGNGTTNASTISFGQADDVPVVGDWDGDGNDDLGVRRGKEWILSPGGGGDLIEFEYGWLTDTPLIGDWDGDGIDDAGLLRQRTWIRRPGLAAGGTELPRVEYANKTHKLIGDWDGDGIDQPGRHDSGAINLDGPLGKLTPRLDPNLPLGETIQRCVAAGEQRYYRGELRAIRSDGNQRTVNAVPVEAYLRAVVPLEMPASWANLGDGAGAEALQAQAVSARSYSLAENRTSYAKTCDTISCQVYGGRAVRRDGRLTTNENALSNTAISDTAGVVRLRDGAVARTEFSSSTGGWTAGGVFPAVEDLGDVVSINPNHDWEIQLEIEDIESRWGGRELDRIFVSERNELGQDGGRVFEVTLVFGEETFTISGNDFRRAFGLKSDWFSVDWKRPQARTDCICPTEWPDEELLSALEEFEG